MAQQDILDFFKKHSCKWYTAREIATIGNLKYTTVTSALKRLRRTNFIEHKLVMVSLYNHGDRKQYVYRGLNEP